MTIIVLGSVRGAPGVTTTALALASVWPAWRGVVVAEADPDGGVLAARRRLDPEPGLVTLAAAIRSGTAVLSDHTHVIGTGVHALIAPPAGEQVRAALTVAGDRLALTFDQAGADVLVDGGRLTTTSPAGAILRHAATTLLLLRPRLDEVMAVRHRVAALREIGVDPVLLLVRDGPYRRDEVAAAVGAALAGEIPLDHRGARALDGPGAGPSARSPLLRSARHLAGSLAGRSRCAGTARS